MIPFDDVIMNQYTTYMSYRDNIDKVSRKPFRFMIWSMVYIYIYIYTYSVPSYGYQIGNDYATYRLFIIQYPMIKNAVLYAATDTAHRCETFYKSLVQCKFNLSNNDGSFLSLYFWIDTCGSIGTIGNSTLPFVWQAHRSICFDVIPAKSRTDISGNLDAHDEIPRNWFWNCQMPQASKQ